MIAGMNQGCIPSLFSMTAIYITVSFYFIFNEVIACSNVVGVCMMVPCVILLAISKKGTTDEDPAASEDGGDESTLIYQLFAVLFGIIAPFFWTTKSYYIRLIIQNKWFDTWDIGFDHVLF